MGRGKRGEKRQAGRKEAIKGGIKEYTQGLCDRAYRPVQTELCKSFIQAGGGGPESDSLISDRNEVKRMGNLTVERKNGLGVG